jgi:hypothetical protein
MIPVAEIVDVLPAGNGATVEKIEHDATVGREHLPVALSAVVQADHPPVETREHLAQVGLWSSSVFVGYHG